MSKHFEVGKFYQRKSKYGGYFKIVFIGEINVFYQEYSKSTGSLLKEGSMNIKKSKDFRFVKLNNDSKISCLFEDPISFLSEEKNIAHKSFIFTESMSSEFVCENNTKVRRHLYRCGFNWLEAYKINPQYLSGKFLIINNISKTLKICYYADHVFDRIINNNYQPLTLKQVFEKFKPSKVIKHNNEMYRLKDIYDDGIFFERIEKS